MEPPIFWAQNVHLGQLRVLVCVNIVEYYSRIEAKKKKKKKIQILKMMITSFPVWHFSPLVQSLVNFLIYTSISIRGKNIPQQGVFSGVELADACDYL